jgi:hypothetical protein
MKSYYYAFRFVLACVLIFGSGYFVARPRNSADRTFAPVICGISVYSLWRSQDKDFYGLPRS